MAISTQAIRYGWVALASLGVITGTTIYVASNARKQVKPEDIIEIALGVHERCLATQTATNPTYSVDPPSIVRTWTSNVYVTNGVTVYTNIVTNTIGWHTDRVMMIDLDTKIKALCPYYVDTNSVYDGTTNIIMHTFTGLLTSLDLGDGTNFTATPCWTNNVGETNCTTNAATYGPWAWRNYVVAWQERYKVLNALEVTTNEVYAQGLSCVFRYSDWSTNWSSAKLSSISYCTNGYHTPENGTLMDVLHTPGANSQAGIAAGGLYDASYFACLNATYITNMYIPVNPNSEVEFSTIVKYICSSNQTFRFLDSGYADEIQMDFDGYGVFEQGGWKTLDFSVPFGIDPSAPVPNWSVDPKGNTNGPYEASVKGFNLQDVITLVDWQFNYCKDKYW